MDSQINLKRSLKVASMQYCRFLEREVYSIKTNFELLRFGHVPAAKTMVVQVPAINRFGNIPLGKLKQPFGAKMRLQ